MPRFQLPVAVALAASALASAALFALAAPKEGQIQLPLHADREREHERDPFDVTVPDDVVDGDPIDEPAFWARTRLRKALLALFFVAALAIQAALLGWSLSLDDRKNALVFALHALFAAYLLLRAVSALAQDTTGPHTESIVHLSALSTLALALLGITALLPTEHAFEYSHVAALWHTVLALYAAAAIVAVTTPTGPPLHFPESQIYSEKTVAAITNKTHDNVCGITGASVWDTLLFSYTTKVVMLGNTAESLDIGDLPIVPGDMRATALFAAMRTTLRTVRLRVGTWRPQPGAGWELIYRLLRLNARAFALQMALAGSGALVYYAPPFFLRELVAYLESDPERRRRAWGWFYAICLFASTAGVHLLTGQLWSISTTTIQVRLKVQLNSILFAKTLVRKDVASSAASTAEDASKKDAANTAVGGEGTGGEKKEDEDEGDFSSKAQIMTLMTTDVDRVSEFAWHLFTLVDSPIEIVIGTVFLYKLLGASSFFGLAATCVFLPLNHFAGKVVVGAQDSLMKARDERVSLMNEILGAIRMLKFMAWERSFEARVLKIREKELKYQKLNYTIETLWNAIWNASPIVVTLVAFYHFAVVRQQVLTPSTAFTSVLFSEMKFALNALPETLINMLQSLVSLRRIEKYLHGAEVAPVPPLGGAPVPVAFQGATVTWPQDRARGASTSAAPSAAPTPRNKFVLVDLNLAFPRDRLSLVCGKLGSGKTLLLLALLGEADMLTGQVSCPRTPPDAIAAFAKESPSDEEWVVEGVCAYVPQTAWLRNASIKDNILFNLPLDERRYQKTLEVCALLNDLNILEDGDESEIGERGVNLSGGQKARVSLARAVYSRASILLLDDVLSAVDAHTAHHLYYECLKGDLMRGRTVVLVSHHVQLCAPGADYVVALDNGRVLFQGAREAFQASDVLSGLVQSGAADADADVEHDAEPETIEADLKVLDEEARAHAHAADASGGEPASETSSTAVTSVSAEAKADRKAPRKLVEEEKRAVGRIERSVWDLYIRASGGAVYWVVFALVLLLAAAGPVAENGWLSVWSGASGASGREPRTPMFYIVVYASITAAGLVITTLRWFILYRGSIHASTVLYKRLLETVLFANIRFHDTVSRGRLLNRFGKDFEGIDSSLSDNFGRSIMFGLSAFTTLVTISIVGGLPFFISAVLLGSLYYRGAQVYGQTSRDMRRLDSVTRSPLYSIYGETIAGVTILRAFGASSKFLRDMLRCVDTNTNPYYWMWGVNRWLSVRFNLLSSAIVGVTAVVAILTPSIDAALAGFILAFASTITNDILFLVRRFVSLEQSMVALERVKEYSELKREPPEFIEPRPPASWPSKGEIDCEGLVIRYAPDLPNVLHNLNFSIRPGEKVGILGRTGSGKSTLALSFFRFVEATEGCIRVDGLDISQIGLTDLRSKLTIIPQDPTILSGTVRSTLDVFNEYQDAEIYEALRRVHLIPSEEHSDDPQDPVNANVFRSLDSPVSEGGDNFSTGEKQLLCMARAILKRSRVLVMDEATASVDYATDELISKTIRHEFAESTILTIAHRLRTVIDYNRVMLLEDGRIVEFDSPGTLLSDPSSKFHSLCKATGKNEFAVLKKMAGAK
ncbi:ABC transporter [Heterobasidion irregulare TC 32-1]|uniref:ABC transporter n=1 Tax=Heterobasidion irregulare (strain TC 32-1) TaxID=747525 RepID=W4JWI2_HETIT|nr:ABC transporter [Heterobasidion irregulare TC 32-1]ETW77907.1 ABC transporter [Heterobasidion irregulare TC 32-1]